MHTITLKFIGDNPKEYFCSYGNSGVFYPSEQDIKNYSLVEVELVSYNDSIVILDECCKSIWDFKGNYVEGMLYDNNWKISEESLDFIKKIKNG